MPKFKVSVPASVAFASVQWSNRQGYPADPIPWKNDASIEPDNFAWIEAGTPKSNTIFNNSGSPSEPYWQLPVLRVGRTTSVGASIGFQPGDFMLAIPNWGGLADIQLKFFNLESRKSDSGGRDAGYLFIKVTPLEQISTQPTGNPADGVQPTGGTGTYDPNNSYYQPGRYYQPPVITAAPAPIDPNFLLGIVQLGQQSAAQREESAARADAAADRAELADRRDRREYRLQAQAMRNSLESQRLSRYPGSKKMPRENDEDEDELPDFDDEEDTDETGLL